MCGESVGEAMGAMLWFDGALDVQLTRTHDAYTWHKDAMPCALEKKQPWA